MQTCKTAISDNALSDILFRLSTVTVSVPTERMVSVTTVHCLAVSASLCLHLQIKTTLFPGCFKTHRHCFSGLFIFCILQHGWQKEVVKTILDYSACAFLSKVGSGNRSLCRPDPVFRTCSTEVHGSVYWSWVTSGFVCYHFLLSAKASTFNLEPIHFLQPAITGNPGYTLLTYLIGDSVCWYWKMADRSRRCGHQNIITQYRGTWVVRGCPWQAYLAILLLWERTGTKGDCSAERKKRCWRSVSAWRRS